MTAKVAAGKVKAADFFAVGKEFGITCSKAVELKAQILGKPTKTVAAKKAAKPKPSKAKKAKSLPDSIDEVKLTPKQKKAIKNADESTGVVEDANAVFVWIASPDEIASTAELHTADY